MSAIAFIGLGQMGAPMAKNLLKQGHQLNVFDVNPQAVQALVESGARAAGTPAQAVTEAEFVITMLPNGDRCAACCSASTAYAKGYPATRWSLICPPFTRCKPTH